MTELGAMPTVTRNHLTAKHPAAGELKDLWRRLGQQEKTVADHPSIGSAQGYIRTVKDILQQALRTHQAKTEGYFSPSGHFRYLVYLHRVNTELEALRQSLTKPSAVHEVMKRMELIRGLLCDLLI
ncbi:MAG: DUF327 family protein [Firmicutes bacterium]|nr:DUF327 family protein [Bacillota bacterium]